MKPAYCAGCGAAAVLFALLALPASAYKDDVGFERLARQLGDEVPTGTGVRVAQVESSVADTASQAGVHVRYGPDPANSGLKGVRFRPLVPPIGWGSAHATTVANLFYGRRRSMAPGIMDVDLIEANDFVKLVGHWPGRNSMATSTARVWNHSWVGGSGTAMAPLLTRLDAVAHQQQWLIVCGVRNKGRNSPLLAAGFNILAVGMSNGRHAKGAAHVNSMYGGARTRPHIVAPRKTSSASVPLVSAAAALLIAAGRDPELARDPREKYALVDGRRRVYNGERATVVTAALLAGARRVFTVPAGKDASGVVPPAYRERPGHRTRNGLDRRFGAGQLDVYNSFQIVAGGEFNSVEDDPDACEIPASGFDFDPAFGGVGDTNRQASYEFEAAGDGRFVAALVWPARVIAASADKPEHTVLHDLNVALVNLSRGGRSVAASNDDADNSEHIYAKISAGDRYRLVVTTADGAEAFAWQYALAWRTTDDPRATRSQ